jgi:hypothetical protein
MDSKERLDKVQDRKKEGLEMEAIRNKVAEYLGRQPTPREMAYAQPVANQKLKRIISSEGSAEGRRLEPEYLAKLIQEVILSTHMIGCTIAATKKATHKRVTQQQIHYSMARKTCQ